MARSGRAAVFHGPGKPFEIRELAIPALGSLILSVIAHKFYVDISLLARQHSGEAFWWAFARYLIKNLAGG